MKNIYLIQPNNALSGSLFLPYSAGTVAAYSFQYEEIRKDYRLCDFIFTKEPLKKALNDIKEPYIVAFSSYMWNVEYNLSLASAIKKKYPDCIIAFGGPQIPDDTEYLENYSFIDILMHGEGELAFYSILRALSCGDSLNNIDNISFRENGIPIKNNRSLPSGEMSYPSPYTMGLFDGIIKSEKYTGIQFDVILETNRGCPYNCIYCCWAGTEKSFRKFHIERVKSDIKWMAENKIAYCVCADSNFGIFDRDEEIADYVIEMKKEYGYPEKFETTAAKDKDELNFRINNKLENAGLNRGVSVAVQSMSDEVLENVGRKNMSVKNLSGQLEKYRKNGIYTYTDIILGLPGETLDSFCKGLFAVIEAGQHYSININRCELLPNTIMYSEEMIKKYHIKTIKSHLCQNHSQITNDDSYGSRSEIVVETSTMSRLEWRTAVRISVCAQSFHCMGLLRFFAIYLRKAKNISYYDFYISVYEYIENGSGFIRENLDKVCLSIELFIQGKANLSFSDKRFGGIYWPFEEGLFLCCAYSCDDFYNDIKDCIMDYFYDDIEMFNDLFNYQRQMIVLPSDKERYIDFSYDWNEYFENLFDASYKEPLRRKTTVKFGEAKQDNWKEYAREIVWYGKRADKMINKDIEYT